jgi:hypothetical protein
MRKDLVAIIISVRTTKPHVPGTRFSFVAQKLESEDDIPLDGKDNIN